MLQRRRHTESSIASWASDVVSVVRSAVSMAEKDESLSAIVEAYGSDINDLYRLYRLLVGC